MAEVGKSGKGFEWRLMGLHGFVCAGGSRLEPAIRAAGVGVRCAATGYLDLKGAVMTRPDKGLSAAQALRGTCCSHILARVGGWDD